MPYVTEQSIYSKFLLHNNGYSIQRERNRILLFDEFSVSAIVVNYQNRQKIKAEVVGWKTAG